jgi:hypothetical protein
VEGVPEQPKAASVVAVVAAGLPWAVVLRRPPALAMNVRRSNQWVAALCSR